MTDDTPWWEQPDKPMEIIPAGTLFVATKDEYSSYTVMGIFWTLVQVDPNKKRKEWLELHPEQREDYKFSCYEFVAWLVAENVIEEMDFCEWFIGAYGGCDKMEVRKDKPC